MNLIVIYLLYDLLCLLVQLTLHLLVLLELEHISSVALAAILATQVISQLCLNLRRL